MAPSKKNTSLAATPTTSKAKLSANRGVGPTDDHPPHSDILNKDAIEGQSSPPTDLREEENGHEAQLIAKDLLLPMLASLQKRTDEQRAKANREREKAALKRDAATCVHNQLIT